VWAAAINICADIGDYDGAIHFVREMNAHGHPPNLLVCSVLLKAFALGAQDELALQALEMMVGRYAKGQPGEISSPPPFHLPQVPPDRIALNTVISACAKAKNLSGALKVLERMKRGEFVDTENGQEVTPDLISYHNILKFCTDPEFAMSLVKDMRLSRRSRVGVITPSSSTYAHAINACQQAVSPSSECAATLLKWALDDGIKPTVYMYAPAIWAAQKSGDRATALNFFVQMTELGCSPNSVAYNGVISALCDNGDVDHAILIYEEMRERGMCTNGPVFKVSWIIVKGIHHASCCPNLYLRRAALCQVHTIP
jgi:pentatricopeptide repeat protein